MYSHIERLQAVLLAAANNAEECASQLREIAARAGQTGDVALASDAAEELMRLLARLPFADLSHIPCEAKKVELLAARTGLPEGDRASVVSNRMTLDVAKTEHTN